MKYLSYLILLLAITNLSIVSAQQQEDPHESITTTETCVEEHPHQTDVEGTHEGSFTSDQVEEKVKLAVSRATKTCRHQTEDLTDELNRLKRRVKKLKAEVSQEKVIIKHAGSGWKAKYLQAAARVKQLTEHVAKREREWTAHFNNHMRAKDAHIAKREREWTAHFNHHINAKDAHIAKREREWTAHFNNHIRAKDAHIAKREKEWTNHFHHHMRAKDAHIAKREKEWTNHFNHHISAKNAHIAKREKEWTNHFNHHINAKNAHIAKREREWTNHFHHHMRAKDAHIAKREREWTNHFNHHQRVWAARRK